MVRMHSVKNRRGVSIESPHAAQKGFSVRLYSKS